MNTSVKYWDLVDLVPNDFVNLSYEHFSIFKQALSAMTHLSTIYETDFCINLL